MACTFTVNLMYARAANSCAFVSHLGSTYTQARNCNTTWSDSHLQKCNGVTVLQMALPEPKHFHESFELLTCCKETKEEETVTSRDCTRLIPWLVPECRSGVHMVGHRDLFLGLVSTVAHKQ